MVQMRIKTPATGSIGQPPRPGPCALVIFGASGDLAHRKLIPALYDLWADGFLPERFQLHGFGRSDLTNAGFAESLRDGIEENARSGRVRGESWKRFAQSLRYVRGAYDDAESYRRLARALKEGDEAEGTEGYRLFYFATPASVFSTIVENLRAADLIYPPAQSSWSRVVIEKPFGHDLKSAKQLNLLTSSVLDETQVYRIDHYLGKETVQNLMVFRFANTIFEPVWNRHHVNHVQLTFAESVGVEGRGRFYEEAGVVRDIVQNHLLQVLALVAMEPPVAGGSDDIRNQKVQVFRSLRPILGGEVAKNVVRGQYDGYRREEGVAPDSVTPTFVAMRFFIDNWRWQGVPFYLRAGKALRQRVTEIAIQFNTIPICVFGRELCERIQPNVLVLRIQPEEGIKLRFALKQPGQPPHIVPGALDFRYSEAFGVRPPDAYERLLLDAMRGDQALFTRSDEVEACWEFCDPILDAWEKRSPGHFPNYEPGSWGPDCADELLAADGRVWREPEGGTMNDER